MAFLQGDFMASNETQINTDYFSEPFAQTFYTNMISESFLPTSGNENDDNGLIKHELLDTLGATTNTLIFCLLDKSPGEEFTRLSIRESIDKHVQAMKNNKEIDAEQRIARIQTGKAAVNYWIDRMVESGTFDKEHTKPVKFWIRKKSSYQKNVPNHKNLRYNHPIWGA